MFDKEKVEYHIQELIKALGENPKRDGLKDTPKRVASMFEEVFEGIKYSNDEIADMFNVTFEEDCCGNSDLVFVKDIEAFSYCEHHMALMYDMKISVAYIPNNKIIGLSKISRIVDMVCKRLTLQEKIGNDISDILSKITGSNDIAVIIKAHHSCVTQRGIRKNNLTITQTLKGKFEQSEYLGRLEL